MTEIARIVEMVNRGNPVRLEDIQWVLDENARLAAEVKRLQQDYAAQLSEASRQRERASDLAERVAELEGQGQRPPETDPRLLPPRHPAAMSAALEHRDLKARELRVAELEHQRDALAERVAELEHQRDALAERVDEERERSTDLAGDVATLSLANETLAERVAEAEAKQRIDEAQCDQMTEDAGNMAVEITRLARELEEEKEIVINLAGGVASCLVERDTLAAEVERLREALDEAVDNCRLAQEAHNAAAARVAEMEAEAARDLSDLYLAENQAKDKEITRLRSALEAQPCACEDHKWCPRCQALEVSE